MTELQPVRILLIDSDPESISAVSMFAAEIRNCSLDVVTNELELLQHNETGTKPDLLVFAHEAISDSQEIFGEIIAKHPDLYSIAILPEQDLQTGKEYREMGAGEGVYRLENYFGNLRHALRRGLINFWGNVATSSAYLQNLQSGKEILQYRILELAGAGIRTDVFKAEDMKENRLVALKILPPSIASNTVVRRRLAREGIAASQLHHPSIGMVYAVEEAEGIAFVVMEYLEGESLAAVLKKGPLGMFRLLEIGSQISDALEVSHQAGRIHANIKPGNIILTPNGAKLLDFGLPQKITRSTPTKGVRGITECSKSGIPWDSLFYFSPEQTRGEDLDARSDLFSIGSLFYVASTGEQPFGGGDVATIVKRIQNDDPVNPSDYKEHLQEEFDGILLHALMKDRTKRLASAAELRRVFASLKGRYIPSAAGVVEKKKEPQEEEIAPPKKKIAPVLATIAIVVVAIASAVFFLVPRKNNPVELLVLPIQITGATGPVDYFSSGLTDSLIEGLSVLHGLRVIQPATAFRYAKFGDASVPAQALDTSYVLIGRWNSSSKGSLEMQLMHVEKGLLWSNKYNPKMEDLFKVRLAIVEELSQIFKISLDQEQKKFLMKQPTIDPEALQLFQQGRYSYYQHSREDLLSSIRQFDDAISRDSDFAAAYSAKSLSFLDLAETDSDPSFYEKAQTSATRALELQEKLSDAHMVLGAINLFYLWNLNVAETELKRALSLNPSSSRAHSYLAMVYTVRQQPDAALDELKAARASDPLSRTLHTEYIRTLTSLRKYDEAIEYAYKHMDQMDPVKANLLLGDAYLGKKSFDEALLAYKRCQDLGSKDVVARIATVLAVDGMQHEGSILLENLLSSNPVDPDLIAAAYAQLGNRSKAMEWLRASYRLRSPDLILLNVDPNFDPLRTDPEFQKLLRLVGLGA